jgi:peptidoglycan/LPS O-acetylase OafA/YrhL
VSGRLEYRPELDGLRALSVLAVIVYHLPRGREVLQAGFIGVDVFFALSGALITQLLLAEREATGSISLGRFYVRRLRRLYPGLLAMTSTVVLAAFVWLDRDAAHRVLWNGVLSAVYLAAFIAPYRPMPLFGHMWSLSIEECFYLAWPAALSLIIRSGRRAVLAFLGLVTLAAFAWRVHLWLDLMASSNRVYFALDTRADALAWGCLVGAAVRWGYAVRARRALSILGPLAGLGLVGLMLHADRSETWFATWGYSLTSILSSVVVARLFVAPAPALALRPLTWIGKLSYSLYLWHVPAIALGSSLGAPPLAALAVGVGLAVASYYAIESRFRAR